jgi:hypothetical protein
MRTRYFTGLACLGASLLASSVSARGLLDASAISLPIDTDGIVSSSGYPGGENPGLALDGNTNTKYLNFGGPGAGIIIPGAASSVVQSLQITTANDAPERDPVTFNLFGTNDPITSADNSTGVAENWQLISSGSFAQDDTRFTALPVVDFANGLAFTSYRITFPELRGGPLFQAAEIGLFDGAGATGNRIVGSPALATHQGPASRTPGAEGVANVLDGDSATKYLNFGKDNTGLIVTPAATGNVFAMVITTANDAAERDPTSYILYGTNDPIQSQAHSDGNGGETWTEIKSGALAPPTERFTDFTAFIGSSDVYASYKVVFPTVRDAAAANSMQIADLQFSNVALIPEPSMLALAMLGGLALTTARRRGC